MYNEMLSKGSITDAFALRANGTPKDKFRTNNGQHEKRSEKPLPPSAALEASCRVQAFGHELLVVNAARRRPERDAAEPRGRRRVQRAVALTVGRARAAGRARRRRFRASPCSCAEGGSSSPIVKRRMLPASMTVIARMSDATLGVPVSCGAPVAAALHSVAPPTAAALHIIPKRARAGRCARGTPCRRAAGGACRDPRRGARVPRAVVPRGATNIQARS